MKAPDHAIPKIALHQMRSGINGQDNLEAMKKAIAAAAAQGAIMYFAPEMSLLLDRNRQRAADGLFVESQTTAIKELCAAAAQSAIWVHLGSAAIRPDDRPDMLANRSIVIDAQGKIRARYDKMHLFDVDLDNGESWRESAAYIAGDKAMLVQTPLGAMGLTICYDLRFPALYGRLAQAGADIFAVPAAFTKPTGAAHWHILLRARAIENAAFVVAAAQSGQHEDGRETYGHSLVVGPWGQILLDMGEGEGLGFAEIDLSQRDSALRQIAVHRHRRDIPEQILEC